MLTFLQFIEEIAQNDLTIPPADVDRMRERFGDKVLKMGHLQEDGSMLVPVDCVVEAANLSEHARSRKPPKLSSKRNFGPAGGGVLQLAPDTGATSTLVNLAMLVALEFDPAPAGARVRMHLSIDLRAGRLHLA